MQDIIKQRELLHTVRMSVEMDEAKRYADTLVSTFSGNDNYSLILGASLATLFMNLRNGKWKTKDSIKIDFFNCVQAFTQPFTFELFTEADKKTIAFDLYNITLQLVSELCLVDGIGIDFRNYSEKKDNLHLVIKPSKLRVSEGGKDFTDDCSLFNGLPSVINPQDPKIKDELMDITSTFMNLLEENYKVYEYFD